MRRSCHKCKEEYEYNGYPNIMIFCPKCGHFDYMCCDFVFGPSEPCHICQGTELLGKVVTKDGSSFLVSEKFNIDRKLEAPYNEALMEAGRIIDGRINHGL